MDGAQQDPCLRRMLCVSRHRRAQSHRIRRSARSAAHNLRRITDNQLYFPPDCLPPSPREPGDARRACLPTMPTTSKSTDPTPFDARQGCGGLSAEYVRSRCFGQPGRRVGDTHFLPPSSYPRGQVEIKCREPAWLMAWLMAPFYLCSLLHLSRRCLRQRRRVLG